MSQSTKILAVALGRVAIGAALAAAPKKAGSGWVGADEAVRPSAGVLLRAVGARDVAIGLGTAIALRHGGSLRPWLVGATLADAVDLGATLAAGRAVPASARAGIVALAGGAVLTQLALLRATDG